MFSKSPARGRAEAAARRSRERQAGASTAKAGRVAGLAARKARRLSRLEERDAAAYEFLAGRLIDAGTLTRAIRLARRWRAKPHEVLTALGWTTPHHYAAALAAHLDVEHWPDGKQAIGSGETVIDAAVYRPDELAIIARLEQAAGRKLVLSSSVVRARPPPDPLEATAQATDGLKRRRPTQSAGTPTWGWQRLAGASLVLLFCIGAYVSPADTAAIILSLLAFPFVFVTLLRTMALIELCSPRRPSAMSPVHDDGWLPPYSVLVPLYDEDRALAGLLAALSAIDYPADRLEVVLIVEAGDHKTRALLNASAMPSHFKVIVVPAGLPRTKPRALNYALQFAAGDFIVVYDAEDEPEPDQLRRAHARLRAAPETIGCVQGRLNIYNPTASWLSRQFTIEYSALFDGLLPTLERFRLPVPLGGTSNHFPRALLEAVGAWDAYNVTEDADLGIRLARRGWGVAILDSPTWEEAPVRPKDWRNQRTRWLKGWMQTLLVHTREPGRLLADLGDLPFMSLMALLGGLILAALVHPWFYLLIAYGAWTSEFLSFPETMVAQTLWGLSLLNLFLGYSVAMLLGVAAVIRRRHFALLGSVLMLPFYWLAISLAAYRAAYQIIRAPYLWEKTPHSGRPKSRVRKAKRRYADG